MTTGVALQLILAATVLGVAPAGAQDQAARNIDVRLRGYEQAVRLDTLAVWTVMPAPLAETYAAAVFVLDTMRVALTRRDSTRGLLFQEPFNTSRNILGKRMSWALHCGEGVSGPNADSFRIHMSYALFFEPTIDKQTRMGVAVAAGANTVEGAFRSALACGSTGRFERELAMLIRARLQLR